MNSLNCAGLRGISYRVGRRGLGYIMRNQVVVEASK